MSQEEEGEFDVTKPSTSYEKIEDIISGTNDDAVKRLSDAMNLMQQPLQKMIELDVSYHASLQEVGRLQEVLNYVDFTSLTRERVDEIFDQMENGLRVAQHLALWKSAVIYEADLKLQDLIGRISEPQQDKQESSKTKGPRSKRIFLTAKENVRRSDREIQTQSVAKGKGKDSPSSSNSTPEQQSLPGRRKKVKVAESNEGRSVFKKRGAGRPRLPRKPRQTTNEATETVEDPNQPDTLYCLCRQVSYGDMILCENSKCNEWYHFPCVQLRQKPKGRWFCPHCRGDRCDVINPDLVG